MKVITLFLLFGLGCGDNAAALVDATPQIDAKPSVSTWEDAEAQYAEAWCLYAERCYPDQFRQYYPGGQKACKAQNTAMNCHAPRVNACDEMYPPERLPDLIACSEDLKGIVCSATEAPPSCYRAFAPYVP